MTGPHHWEIAWTTQAITDMQFWSERHDRKRIERVRALIDSIKSDPFTGIGKPEPLRYQLSGAWSRRIDREHRLTDRVRDGVVQILSARFHYEK